MNYHEVIKKVARIYNTTAEDVDREIRLAISYTGSKTEPTEFIKMIISEVKTKTE